VTNASSRSGDSSVALPGARRDDVGFPSAQEARMSDMIKKATDAAKDVVDKVKDSDTLEKVEDKVEEQAAKGGTMGKAADLADDAIDTVQGSKD
jgi:hypothetical protein